MNVTITKKDGTVKRFNQRRGGGSYENKVRYEPGWVVVTDVWGNEVAFPASEVETVEASPARVG